MAPKQPVVLPLGDNCAATLAEDGILTVVINTKHACYKTQPKLMAGGALKGGGNMMIATTRGNQAVPDGQGGKISINYYRPPKAGE